MIPHKYLTMVLDSLPWVLPLLVYFVLRLALLTASLWIMLRAQSLSYTIPGIIGCSALASACDMIPFGGHPLAVGVLIFSIIRLTGAHFIDVRFTVVISYAVTFLIQMVALSVMPLEANANARTLKEKFPSVFHAITIEDSDYTLPKNSEPSTKPDAETNQTVTPAPKAQVVAPSAAQPAVAPVSVAPLSKSVAGCFTLKGVMGNSGDLTVMIGTGVRTYSLQIGETATMDTSAGKMDVTVVEANQTGAVLKIGGNRLPLQLR
jgi:hypothetical protein